MKPMTESTPILNPKIPVSSIVCDGKHQVRFAESEADQALLNESIAEYGVLVPLLLHQLPQQQYRPIDGHRRLKGAKANGQETVPGYVFSQDISELDCLSMALTTNGVRKNLTILEKYQAVWRHHTEGGLTVTEAARRCGLSQSAGTKLLASVQNNPQNVILAFTKQRASYRALYALTKCPTDEDKRELAKRFLSGELNVSQLEAEIKSRFGKKKGPRTIKLVLRCTPSYDAVLAELARLKKRVLQLQRTNVDAQLLPTQVDVAPAEGSA